MVSVSDSPDQSHAQNNIYFLLFVSDFIKFTACFGENPALLDKHLLLSRTDCTEFWEEHLPWADSKQEVTAEMIKVVATLHQQLREECNQINTHVLRETEKMHQSLKKWESSFCFVCKLSAQPATIQHLPACKAGICATATQAVFKVDQFKSGN